MNLFLLWVLVLLYTVTSAVYGFNLYQTYKKSKELSMAFFCKAMYLLIEGLVPLIIIGGYTVFGKTFDALAVVDFSENGIFGLLYYWLLSVIGYIALCLGIRLNYRITFGKKAVKPNKTEDYPISLAFASYISLAIGIVSFYLWTKAYG